MNIDKRKKPNVVLRYFQSKNVGFYLASLSWILTLAHLIVYQGVAPELFSGQVVTFGLAGVILFAALSVFPQTSELAPISLMVCNFLCITSFASIEGIIDYFSTQFFDGFSMQALFELPFAVWFSVVAFVSAFVLASVAMYVPQVRRRKR